MTSEALVHVRGRFVAQSEAWLSLHDAGFVLGATVSDLCRTFRHHLFRLEDHIGRFCQSCRLARVPLAHSADSLQQIAMELVEHNSRLVNADEDLALVMCATPGPLPHYLVSAEQCEPTLMMLT